MRHNHNAEQPESNGATDDLVTAKLIAGGAKVGCGACEAPMAMVHRFAPKRVRFDLPTDGIVRYDTIQFLAGWAPRKNGVWALTNHARKLIASGRPPALRRQPKNGGFPKGALSSRKMWLPKFAECPDCGLVNLLIEERLDVVLLDMVPASADGRPPVRKRIVWPQD